MWGSLRSCITAFFLRLRCLTYARGAHHKFSAFSSILYISSITGTIQGYKGNATMRWDGPRTECFMMTHRDSTGNRPSGDGVDLFITISLSRQRFYYAISLSREPLRFLYHGNICICRDATFALRNAKVAAIKRLTGPLDERIP